MVDVHILILPDTNKDWLFQCLMSLKDEPAVLHLCPGLPGDTSAARTEAFKRGNLPYVAFVDPDDLVVPGVIGKLVSLLESTPDAVCAYSDEMLVNEAGIDMLPGWSRDALPYLSVGYDIRCHCIDGKYIHHLRVMRRVSVERCLPLKTKRMPEPVLMHDLAKLGKLIHLPEIGYKWRIHGNNTFSTYTKAEYDEGAAWCHQLIN